MSDSPKKVWKDNGRVSYLSFEVRPPYEEGSHTSVSVQALPCGRKGYEAIVQVALLCLDESLPLDRQTEFFESLEQCVRDAKKKAGIL